MENYEHIFYADCPHFTVGRVDQWGEQGYLLFEGQIYSYEEDRKDQCGRTYSPMTIEDFLAYAERNQLEVPEDFLEKLRENQPRMNRNNTNYFKYLFVLFVSFVAKFCLETRKCNLRRQMS